MTAASILIIGGIAHVASYPYASGRLGETALPPSLIAADDVTWLADSTNLWSSAASLWVIAAIVRSAPAVLIAMLGIAPLVTAALIYAQFGFFYGGHMLGMAALLVFGGAWVKHRRGGVAG